MIASAVFLSLSTVTPAAWWDAKADFTNYDAPLNEQIIERIRARVSARLGDGPNTGDRYFIIPFAYQNRGNEPEYSHSFITVIRVIGEDRQPTRRLGFRTGTYRQWKFEAYNISWIPHDFLENPNLCVFKGFGARLFPRMNRCPISVGRNFNLEDTLKIAVNARVAVGMWGPYEIRKEAFDLGVGRKKLLDSGTIRYRADDRLYRRDRVAINCFNAMAGLNELFPNGGLFGTGFKVWGLNGTKRVLLEYTTKASNKGLLLEPVDIRRDLKGFVYTPARGRRGYNPFRNSAESPSAYWR